MTFELILASMNDEQIDAFEQEMDMSVEEYLDLINQAPFMKAIAEMILTAILTGGN